MVKHIILWTLKEELTESEKGRIKADIKAGLEGLAGKIPGLLEIRVHTQGLPSSNADLMLDSSFVDEAALKGYAVHPEHVAVAEGKVRPYTAVRSCLDYEAASCPCKRARCPRHGDCQACREHHKTAAYRTACEQSPQRELITPFGSVNMYRNGQRICFQIESYDYGMHLNDGTLQRPQGLFKLYPDMEKLEKGDILICEFDSGHLEQDGGDEYMTNIVGTYQGYTVGMGAPDSQDIEGHYSQRERVLPYETWGSTGKGFEIRIIDSPEKYPCTKSFQQLCFVVAWEPGTADDIWNLISFVTC